jgi:hypothetical protein
MKTAKCFLLGAVAGIILFSAVFFLLYPQYSDYRAKAEVTAWLEMVKNVQDDIGKKIVSASPLGEVNDGFDKTKFQAVGVDLFEITETGVIIIRGGRDGQVIILIPSFSENDVEWRCIGGSAQAVPSKCN